MIDEVKYDDVILNYKRYNALSSCTAEATLTQSQCSLISAQNEALEFDFDRSVASYDTQDSFFTDALLLDNANFYIRNVGTNMFMTVESDCRAITLQPFDGSDAQRFMLRQGRNDIIQNKMCEGTKVLQIPYTSCSTTPPIMHPYHGGRLQSFRYSSSDGRIYNIYCESEKSLSAKSDSIPGSKPILEPHEENNPLHQWNIELLDEG